MVQIVNTPQELELVCPRCQTTELCAATQMMARLRSLALLRRDNKPDPAMIVELFRHSSSKFECHACGGTGLAVREPDSSGWNETRLCAGCRTRIPAERLELFPNADRCAACETKLTEDSENEPEFCRRCGSILQLKLRSGAGLSRYEMICSQCGPRR